MDPQTVALQATGGFIAGALLGYAVRKATKWFLLAIGFTLLPIFIMWKLGLIEVNWEAINELIGKIIQWIGINLSNMSQTVASAGILGVCGAAGFIFGLSGGFRQSIMGSRYVRRKNLYRYSKRHGTGTSTGKSSAKPSTDTAKGPPRETKASNSGEA